MQGPELNAQCRQYVLDQAPVLFFRIDPKGHILETNRYTEKTADIPSGDRRFQAVLLDFNASFDLTCDTLFSGEHLMGVKTRSGYPETYLFSFKRLENNILVFGHMNLEEVEQMRREMLQLNQELGNSSRQLHKKNAQLQAALAHIKTLQGIIPICSYCHKIRNDEQIWERLEKYLTDHTHADFSHGICPACLEKHFPEDTPENGTETP